MNGTHAQATKADAGDPGTRCNGDGDKAAFCHGHARFTETAAVHRFKVQNEVIVLRHHPDVFPPSSFGLQYAEQIDFRGCRRMVDIGTGTGLLAILAAKKGVPTVEATDLSERAVKVAAHNARHLNSVARVGTRQGHFFCDLPGLFDVITANLPQEIIPPGYRADLTPLQRQAIDGGGAGGNAILLDFLDVAPAYMHETSRLYIIINTVTDYKQTLRFVRERFDVALVWEGSVRAKAFVRENSAFFRDLIDAGTVSLVEDASGQWRATQFIYRLTVKRIRSLGL